MLAALFIRCPNIPPGTATRGRGVHPCTKGMRSVVSNSSKRERQLRTRCSSITQHIHGSSRQGVSECVRRMIPWPYSGFHVGWNTTGFQPPNPGGFSFVYMRGSVSDSTIWRNEYGSGYCSSHLHRKVNKAPMELVEKVWAESGRGLVGDRYYEGRGSYSRGTRGARQVTIQYARNRRERLRSD